MRGWIWTASLALLAACVMCGALPVRAQEQQTAVAQTFMTALVQGNYQAAATFFDQKMLQALPPAQLKTTWESIIAQVGPLQKIVGTRLETTGNIDTVYVTCQFARTALDTKMVLNSQQKISGLWFVPVQAAAQYQPPAYADPATYTEYPVTIGTEPWALPGTLTLPKGKGPFPAIVLVHGSGPNDRDETLGPNKPFCDLAWGLATQGIAVLRYDKRTRVHAKQFTANSLITVKEEVLDDALAAVTLLRQVKSIDAKRIFVLGHSLGGTLIPRIGKADTTIAGFVILAGSTRPLEDIFQAQYTYLASIDGAISPQERAQLDEVAKQVARVKDPQLAANTPAAALLGVPGAYWLDLRGYRPAEVAKELAAPMLILQGERDYQVTLRDDFQGWKQALSGKNTVTLKSYPRLNHLFIAGNGPSVPAEYEQAGHVDAPVVEDIANWIKVR